MSSQPKRGVIGSLPHTRPHRRSDKRPQSTGPVTPTGVDGASATDSADAAATEPPTQTARTARQAAATGGTAKPTTAGRAARQSGAPRSAKPKPAATRSAKPKATEAGEAKPKAIEAAEGKPKATATRSAKPKATATRSSEPSATTSPPADDKTPGVLETAVQAAAELTEIGLQAGARALRRSLSRLSR